MTAEMNARPALAYQLHTAGGESGFAHVGCWHSEEVARYDFPNGSRRGLGEECIVCGEVIEEAER